MQALWSQPHHTSRGTASAGGAGGAQHPPSWFLSGSLPAGVPQVGRCMRASAQPKGDFPQRHQVASTSHLSRRDFSSTPPSQGLVWPQLLPGFKKAVSLSPLLVGGAGDLGSLGGQRGDGGAGSTRSCIRSSSRHRGSHPHPSPAAPGARSSATAGPQLPLTLIPSLVQSTAPQRGPRLRQAARTGGWSTRRAVHVSSSTPLHPQLHPHSHGHPASPLSLPGAR